MAIPTTNENIDIEQTFVGDVKKPLDGSEFNNTDPIINKLRLMPNNQYSLPVNQDDEFIQVAKYSGISSVITDFVTPVLTYPLRKIEDILTKSDTTFGKSIRRENELKKAETFVGPKVVGTEVKTPSFEPTNSASYFTRTNDTVDLNLSQIIPTKGAAIAAPCPPDLASLAAVPSSSD